LRNNIFSEKDGFLLRGHQRKVEKAYKEILHLMLKDPTVTKQDERKKKKKIQRGTSEYISHMVEEEESIPVYWSKNKGESIKGILKSVILRTHYEKVKLAQTDICYKAIEDVFKSTFDPKAIGVGQDAKGLEHLGYTRLQVKKIERIENIKVYQGYHQKRRRMFTSLNSTKKISYRTVKDLPNSSRDIATASLTQTLHEDMNPQVNEVYMFHGAKKKYIEKICEEGLDPRIASSNAMFGAGVYGAEKSSKADQYTGI